jgi:hypothetical protein
LPGWLSLDSQTGLLGGRPTQNDIGVSAGVSLKVIDEAGLSDEVSGIRFEVIDVNDVPTLNLSQVPARLLGREEVQVQVFPDDSDGDPVSIEVEDNRFIRSEIDHGWLTLTVSDVNEVTDVNLVLKAFDPRGGVTREILPIRVYPVTASGRGVTLAGIRQGRAVHVVVLGDGYAADQQALFREHVERTMVSLQSDPGIAGHMDALSIHMVGTVSKDSGADDTDQVDARDTYYDSTYNCGSIQRLICANTLTLLETALDEYPDFDQVILLVNDRRYGGSGNSGGSTAITSAYAPEIALHEMGHSLANLADEYVDNLIVETQDLGYGVGMPGEAAGYTDPQRATIVRIVAFESLVHGIPLVVPSAWDGHGIGSHTDPFGYPYWTNSVGKVCPGAAKKADLLRIIAEAEAQALAWIPTPPPTPPEHETVPPIDTPEGAPAMFAVIVTNAPTSKVRETWLLCDGTQLSHMVDGHAAALFMGLDGFQIVRPANADQTAGLIKSCRTMNACPPEWVGTTWQSLWTQSAA